MNASLVLDNLLAYGLQVTIAAAVAGIAVSTYRIRAPRARLLFWQTVLCACLLLPVVQPWKRQTIVLSVSSKSDPAPAMSTPSGARRWPVREVVLGALATGMLLRAASLGLGLLPLRRYRRSGQELNPVPPDIADLRLALAPATRVCLSPNVSGPVTFGGRHPVVLLPDTFPRLDPAMQQAIVCHELLHVARHDWTYTMAEEVVRAVLWFHPAIWWVLGQVHLSREQVVDEETVAITGSRAEYVDALLSIAGAKTQPDLAPAPLFLHRRQLKKRVVSILEITAMSKLRIAGTWTAGIVLVAAACWLAVVILPLAASPQAIVDAPGVSIEMGGANILHRAALDYPEAARQKGVQGTVVVDASLASDGSVSGARVVSGPDELRKAALESVLQWHFSKNSGTGPRQVSVTFALPAQGAQPDPAVPNRIPAVPRRLAVMPPGRETATLKRLAIIGLSPEAERELRAQLSVSEGATLNNDNMVQLQKTVSAFDEHLQFGLRSDQNGSVSITILAPVRTHNFSVSVPWPPAARDAVGGVTGGVSGGVVGSQPSAASPMRIPVGGNVQAAKLTYVKQPEYPPLAKQARIQGTVKMNVTISKEGNVDDIRVIEGHPLLVQAAMEAVRTWTYAQTLLNGVPVEVVTQVDVNFTLAE